MVGTKNIGLFFIKLLVKSKLGSVQEKKKEEKSGPDEVERSGYFLKRLDENGKQEKG